MRRPWKLFAITLMAASLSLPPAIGQVGAQAPASAEVTAVQPPRQFDFSAEKLAEDTPVLEIAGETIDIEHLRILYSVRPMQERRLDVIDQLPRLRGEDLKEVGGWVASYGLMARKAEESGITLDEGDEQAIKAQLGRLKEGALFIDVVASKLEPITDEQIEKQYETFKERFEILEELRMRHIFISTYVPYEVKEGDTLESIAREVSGDESMASAILSDETKRPRAESLPKPENVVPDHPADARELAPRALTTGEKLLVPGGKEVVEDARNKALEAIAELEKGTSFEDVAASFSAAEQPGRLAIIRPKQDKQPIMQELREAFAALENGKWSQPIRTRHGWQVVMREGYTEAGYRPLDEVREQLKSTLENEQRTRLAEEFFNRAVQEKDVASVDVEKLKAENGSDDDVIVTIGEREFKRSDIAGMVARDLKTDETLQTEEGLREAIAKSDAIRRALVESYMAAKGYADRKSMKDAERYLRETFLANRYLEKVATEQSGDIADEAIQKFYEDNKMRFRVVENYELYGAVVKLGEGTGSAEEEKQKLEGRLAAVQSLADFSKLATQVNPTGDIRFRGEGGIMGQVAPVRLRSQDLDAIKGVTIPGKSEVVVHEDEVIVYWVEKHNAETFRPVDEVRDQIKNVLQSDKSREAAEKIREEYVEQATAEVKVLKAGQAG